MSFIVLHENWYEYVLKSGVVLWKTSKDVSRLLKNGPTF